MTLRRARQILAKEGPRELFERVRNCNRDGIDGDAVEEYDRWCDPDYASSEEGEAEDEDEDDDVEGEGQDDDEIEKGEGQDETEMVVVEEEEVEAGRQEPGDSSLRCCQLLSHLGGRWGCTLRCEFMLSPDCIHARAGLMMLFVLEAANRAPTARQPPASRLPPRPTHPTDRQPPPSPPNASHRFPGEEVPTVVFHIATRQPTIPDCRAQPAPKITENVCPLHPLVTVLTTRALTTMRRKRD